MARARLREIELPDFGMPGDDADDPGTRSMESDWDGSETALRLEAMTSGWCTPTGSTAPTSPTSTVFDPRFEEAVLIVGRQGLPLLLTGTECVGMAEASPLPDTSRAPSGSEPSKPATGPVPTARRHPRRRRYHERRSGAG